MDQENFSSLIVRLLLSCLVVTVSAQQDQYTLTTMRPHFKLRNFLQQAARNTDPTIIAEDTEKKQYFAIRGNVLGNIAADLSDFYAKTTAKFADFVELIDEFQLDSNFAEAEDLNGELLIARVALIQTMTNSLQDIIKEISEISLLAITHPYANDMEDAASQLLAKSRVAFSTIIETSQEILSSLTETNTMQGPQQSRVVSAVLSLSKTKLSGVSTVLQQIAISLQNKDIKREDIRNIVEGIHRLQLVDTQIRNELLLAALHVELAIINGNDGNPLISKEDEEDDVRIWKSVLHIDL